ncbi:helix-turn-helix domain-containing protein [Arthrobacter sp. MYb213]|uniref:helix-turn-helix domain-containing protein n=1 Tax=Arthrobacter sp. MYb213 TaxID=1848595 RepID=UPI000CFC80C7|nr:helix-turn-helix domain-containing protein [Arthrobacter sp. MYb213]PRB72813.1 transcriptional regulator [Arthrobacter sp. MYb213]
MTDIGRVVAARRRQLGYTQTQMAIELGLTQRYVSELENGKTSSLNTRTLDVLDQLGIELGFKVRDD